MIDILKEHCMQYPKMEITDAVKLIYQNEFGGGHMIADEEKSLLRLKEEYGQVQKNQTFCRKETIFEPIGNGLVRIYLDSGLLEENLETVNRFFKETANSHKGTIDGFENKLSVFVEACKNRELPFSAEEAESFIGDYKKNGYPAVSHSEIYRTAYRPAYRVVWEAYARYYQVFAEIDRLLKKQERVIAAIDGKSGSGKSTLGSLLKTVYGCSLIHMDHFFLQPGQRTPERLSECGGNVDYERFSREVLDKLLLGGEFSYQVFDCSMQMLTDYIRIKPGRLTVIEGSYSHHPVFGFPFDLKICLDIGAREQRERILKRNGEAMLKRFEEEWIPKENAYLDAFQIRENSQILSF